MSVMFNEPAHNTTEIIINPIVTGVHIAWLFAMEIRKTRDVSKTKRPKLFVCAPSNESVDLIASRSSCMHTSDQLLLIR